MRCRIDKFHQRYIFSFKYFYSEYLDTQVDRHYIRVNYNLLSFKISCADFMRQVPLQIHIIHSKTFFAVKQRQNKCPKLKRKQHQIEIQRMKLSASIHIMNLAHCYHTIITIHFTAWELLPSDMPPQSCIVDLTLNAPMISECQ